eukprot:3814994-Rhodomonas_salina.1
MSGTEIASGGMPGTKATKGKLGSGIADSSIGRSPYAAAGLQCVVVRYCARVCGARLCGTELAYTGTPAHWAARIRLPPPR